MTPDPILKLLTWEELLEHSLKQDMERIKRQEQIDLMWISYYESLHNELNRQKQKSKWYEFWK